MVSGSSGVYIVFFKRDERMVFAKRLDSLTVRTRSLFNSITTFRE